MPEFACAFPAVLKLNKRHIKIILIAMIHAVVDLFAGMIIMLSEKLKDDCSDFKNRADRCRFHIQCFSTNKRISRAKVQKSISKQSEIGLYLHSSNALLNTNRDILSVNKVPYHVSVSYRAISLKLHITYHEFFSKAVFSCRIVRRVKAFRVR